MRSTYFARIFSSFGHIWLKGVKIFSKNAQEPWFRDWESPTPHRQGSFGRADRHSPQPPLTDPHTT